MNYKENPSENEKREREIKFHQSEIARLKAEIANERKTYLWAHVKDMDDEDLNDLMELIDRHFHVKCGR